ncbi:TPA: hypothetical protein JBG74_13845 [Legionella pneumophila]|uniref:Uncharacterized protein n=2 Tax=Legionella pneumophila TaxID=446 RepID=Q5ZTL9_LEGPH|nr:hypothetical protein [Legionella pneumophila]AAU28208.1 hypothetical protein lpg2142 [Legionella pneumophila subsp. pneumophila str. Philadelphia 1]AEW52383.1 hypothetical protein lp12_2134 [Legionella pneumophila subsp. pneumophila ATCC 43290]AGH53051.1 hypothetical protein LPE509_00960 [Legionella pneumophila subsp. pneumophila LPE509]AOU05103.1 hypothetical protein A9E97_10495 [Legionella pneumophila]AOU08116.1 hypothetical protein A9E98_10795 [Legionella pneumophila]
MPASINSKRLIFNALFQIYLMWVLDKDYIRSSQYPESVWAEEMRKHRLEALARNIKFHTRLRDGINASSARTIQNNGCLIHNSRYP